MKKVDLKRGTRQPLMPSRVPRNTQDNYTLYPFFSIQAGCIQSGYDTLAEWIAGHRYVKVDGYVGVDWEGIKGRIAAYFEKHGIRARWIHMDAYLKDPVELEEMIHPYLGAEGSVWGKHTTLTLQDFFNLDQLEGIEPDTDCDVTIIWGTGAYFVSGSCHTVYLDLPKNELLFRMRAGDAFNIGADRSSLDPMHTYKRFYFVDWIVLNQHKQSILDDIDVYGDTQWTDTLNWLKKEDLFQALNRMSTSIFRPRPWFDPGIWGGQWMKERFTELGRDEENYAWSFEIIAPENGIVLESSGYLLEVSFDMLMFREGQHVLGKDYSTFGSFFPIRFDFLDTFDGGNLSIQCHPSLSYIQEHFGEKFTQDETYYIMDCKEDARVFLGFQENIDPVAFRQALEESVIKEQEIDITEYVRTFKSEKHNLYLIPNQTIHSSGKNNMVLEISATPYIFTFKMYDWLQKDKNGKPRPINIAHAFNNLDFSRKGKAVDGELISRPYPITKDSSYELIHYPTHAQHYYDVHRLDIKTEVQVKTAEKVHVLMLVEGTAVEVEDANGIKTVFNYAETFIVPAGNEMYKIKNLGADDAKVIKAFLK